MKTPKEIIEEFDENEDFRNFIIETVISQLVSEVEQLKSCLLHVNNTAYNGMTTLVYIPNENINRLVNDRIEFVIQNTMNVINSWKELLNK